MGDGKKGDDAMRVEEAVDVCGRRKTANDRSLVCFGLGELMQGI
jgi:hypothetical protein